MILVAGATGFLGREICRRLAEQGEPIRCLVRASSDPEVVGQLRAMGAEIVLGDLKEHRSLDAACAGVGAVVSTATVTRSRQQGDSIEASDQQGQLNLVEAARTAGVSRFVYISYSGQIDSDDPLTRAKRAVEHAVRQSGMSYTILRPSYFMEAWLGPNLGFDYENAKATIYGSGTKAVSWISLGDVAEFAVRSLVDAAAGNATLELGGPEALSPREVVQIFEEESGRTFEVQLVSEEMLRAQQAQATDSLQQTFAALMLNYAAGDPIPMEETLRTFPVRLRSVREYARAAVGSAPAGAG
jgi:uncharacterized protein YbjT (DUF2867 family)